MTTMTQTQQAARLVLIFLASMLLAACATPAEATAGIIAGAGMIAAVGTALAPYLPADKAAEVVELMRTAQTVSDAVASGFGVIARQVLEANALARSAVEAAQAAQATANHADAGSWTAEQLTIGGGAVVAGAAGLIRAMRGKPEAKRQAERAAKPTTLSA